MQTTPTAVQQTCETIACQFSYLAPTVQGALIGAGSAIIGTLLTVAISAATTMLQLRHQRKESGTDRALGIKKDILLDTLRAVARMRNALANMLVLQKDRSDIQEQFNRGSMEASLAHGVASPNVVRALQQFIEECSVRFIELLQDRIEIDHSHRSLEAGRDRIVSLSKVVDALNERRQKLQGLPDTPAFVKELRTIVDRTQEAVNEANAESEAMNVEFNAGQEKVRAAGAKGVRFQLELHAHYQRLAQVIRAEIGVDKFPSEEYLKVSGVSEERVQQTLESIRARAQS